MNPSNQPITEVECKDIIIDLVDSDEDQKPDLKESCWLGRLRPRSYSVDSVSSQGKSQKPLKWRTLEHNGPLFPAAYERLPADVHFIYDNCPIELTEQAEEVATFYAKLLRSEFVQLPNFKRNFFHAFRSCLSNEQRRHITSFELCNFLEIQLHLETRQPAREQAALKHYHGYCSVDGQRHRVANFRIPTPGLCCPPRASSLTMGLIRPRVLPEDILINCDEQAPQPQPPPGHRWARVLHDRSLSWLYSWHDLLSGSTRFAYACSEHSYRPPPRVQLETARRLQQHLGRLRRENRELCFSEQWLLRQRSVAFYCVDQLAFSCEALCALRVGQLQLDVRRAGQRNVARFRMSELVHKQVSVPAVIFYNLSVLVCSKQPHELIFEELTAALLNAYLDVLMDGVNSEVFRICNACLMLLRHLALISPTASLCDKLKSYNRALKKIHNFCADRQRNIVPLPAPRLRRLGPGRSSAEQSKLRTIGLHTKPLVEATLPYLDPRISICWCLRSNVPIAAIYQNSSLRKKLKWALDCTTEHFCF